MGPRDVLAVWAAPGTAENLVWQEVRPNTPWPDLWRRHEPSLGQSRRPHPGAPYYASGVLSISLPYSTYGLDVLACIGWRHAHDHCQLVEIQREVQQRGLLINERTVGKRYRPCLALLGGMSTQHQQRLETAAHQHAGLIWALDALQPRGSDRSRYVLYAVLSNTPISALQERNPTADRLHAWWQPYTHCAVALLAPRSDGEKAAVAALKTTGPAVPQQRCQLHFLHNVATLALEVAARLRLHLRDALGTLAAVPTACSAVPPGPTDDAAVPLWHHAARYRLDGDRTAGTVRDARRRESHTPATQSLGWLGRL
jgi:hypothetical protein